MLRPYDRGSEITIRRFPLGFQRSIENDDSRSVL